MRKGGQPGRYLVRGLLALDSDVRSAAVAAGSIHWLLVGAFVASPAVVCGVVAVAVGLFALARYRLGCRPRSHLGQGQSRSNVGNM
jgi:hypothetical protein